MVYVNNGTENYIIRSDDRLFLYGGSAFLWRAYGVDSDPIDGEALINAFKHAQGSGKVAIGVSTGVKNDGTRFIEIRDNGVGFPRKRWMARPEVSAPTF